MCCESDASRCHIKAKISSAEEMEVLHTMVATGSPDLQAKAFRVQVHGKGNCGARPRAEVIAYSPYFGEANWPEVGTPDSAAADVDEIVLANDDPPRHSWVT